MDLRQSPNYARFMAATGWQVEKVGPVFTYIRNLIFGLKIAKVQRFSSLNLAKLESLLHRQRVIYSILEPESDSILAAVKQHRFRLSHSPYLPTRTSVIDLTQNQKDLLSHLSTNLKRILSRPSESKMVQSQSGNFYSAWRQNHKVWIMSQKDFKLLLKNFGPKAKLYASQDGTELVSGVVVLICGSTAFYYQAWTSPKGRKLNAHHHLVWKMLLDLKRQGVKQFDFDGLDDPRNHRASWQGFSEFKGKFGGKTVNFPGSFQRWF